MQPTVKLFETQPFLRQFTARVLGCTPAGAGWAVALDATAFFPEGGGQPCDTGTLGGVAVCAVHLDAEGVILHQVAAPLALGAAVEGLLDWPARLDRMQQHTGEHILSGTLHRLFGAQNVGFHIGEPAVRMDLDRPLSAAQLAQAVAQANAVVQADVAVRCWYPPAAELAALCYRSKKELTGPVRLVEIPGADLCACCGTHLERTGQVGYIRLLSAQSYKGGVRLAVACGARACEAAAAEAADAQAAAVLLSAPAAGLAPAVERLLAAQAAEKLRLAGLQNSLAAAFAAAAQPGTPQVLFAEGPDGDGLRRICLAVAKKAGALCAVLAPGGQGLAYALCLPEGDVRPLCKALNTQFAGRGGGKPGFCQGSLAAGTPEQVRAFLLEAGG